jgi:hypothetical protein
MLPGAVHVTVIGRAYCKTFSLAVFSALEDHSELSHRDPPEPALLNIPPPSILHTP